MSRQPRGPHDPRNTDLGENRSNPSTTRASQLPSDIDPETREPRTPPRETVKMEDVQPTSSAARRSPSMINDVGRSTSEGTPMFSGDPSDLRALLFHLQLKATLDPALEQFPRRKCAYLATCLKGQPLEWLERRASQTPQLLYDYDLLERSLKEVYDLPDKVRERIAEARIMRLKQTGTVMVYAAELESLATELEWPASAKRAMFFGGLQHRLQERLIENDVMDTFDEMRDEAIRLDSSLRTLGSTTDKVSRRQRKKGSKVKCGKCGRTNHKTDQCFAKTTVKTTVNAIRVHGKPPVGPVHRIQGLELQGQELSALLDTGAKVNCIRAELARGVRIKSDLILEDPIGRKLVEETYYVTDNIDGIPQQLFLLPGLTEEVILGEPYLQQTVDLRTFPIETTGPIEDGGRLRTLSSPEQDALDEYIEEKMRNGVIRPSRAPTAANVLFVPKKDGRLRMCVDYRKLNSVTRRDRYPLPLLKDLLNEAAGFHYFASIDIEEAFNHISVRAGDEYKTAFRTNRGQFEYTKMPFGVTNGPSVFQRYMDHILKDERRRCVVYLDDILIFGDTEEETIQSEKRIREVLAKNEIRVNDAKSKPIQTSANFLGFHVDSLGVTANIDHDTIDAWPRPKNTTDLQSFLGLLNWYRDHIPNFASIAQPLYSLTGKREYEWRKEHQKAFEKLKQASRTAVTIYNFDPIKDLHVYTDASQYALGAILVQDKAPIAIISRSLSPAERNYTTQEREVLGVVWTVRKLRHLFESTRANTLIHTDHMAITQTLNNQGHNRRLNRWAEILMPLPLKYLHVSGKTNPADHPSRRNDYVNPYGGGGEADVFSEDEYPDKLAFYAQQPMDLDL